MSVNRDSLYPVIPRPFIPSAESHPSKELSPREQAIMDIFNSLKKETTDTDITNAHLLSSKGVHIKKIDDLILEVVFTNPSLDTVIGKINSIWDQLSEDSKQLIQAKYRFFDCLNVLKVDFSPNMLASEEERISLAKQCIARGIYNIDLIADFSIHNKEARIEIARLVATKNVSVLKTFLPKYHILDEQSRFDIIKSVVAGSDNVEDLIDGFQLTNKAMLAELADLVSQFPDKQRNLLKSIKKFHLEKVDVKKIIDRCLESRLGKIGLIENIRALREIIDEEKRLEIFEKSFLDLSPSIVIVNLDKFDLPKEVRMSIARRCMEDSDGRSALACNINRFEMTDQELDHFAFLLADSDAAHVFIRKPSLSKFHIGSPEKLLKMAKLCVARYPHYAELYVRSFNIKDSVLVAEFYLLAVRNGVEPISFNAVSIMEQGGIPWDQERAQGILEQEIQEQFPQEPDISKFFLNIIKDLKIVNEEGFVDEIQTKHLKKLLTVSLEKTVFILKQRQIIHGMRPLNVPVLKKAVSAVYSFRAPHLHQRLMDDMARLCFSESSLSEISSDSQTMKSNQKAQFLLLRNLLSQIGNKEDFQYPTEDMVRFEEFLKSVCQDVLKARVLLSVLDYVLNKIPLEKQNSFLSKAIKEMLPPVKMQDKASQRQAKVLREVTAQEKKSDEERAIQQTAYEAGQIASRVNKAAKVAQKTAEIMKKAAEEAEKLVERQEAPPEVAETAREKAKIAQQEAMTAQQALDDANTAVKAIVQTMKGEKVAKVGKEVISVEEKAKPSESYEKKCYKIFCSLSIIFESGKEALLIDNPEDKTIDQIAKESVKDILPGVHEEELEKIITFFDSSRNPQAIWQYAAKMHTLKDPTVLSFLGTFMTSVANGSFKEMRYDLNINFHLQVLGQKTVDAWKIPLEEQEISQGKVAVDSDDPTDVLLCGTEIPGSCQSVTGDPNYNKALLGYLMNGSRLLLVRDKSSGQIVSRAILRILWDGEKPVLFLEKRYGHQSHEKDILNLAKSKATQMSLDLTAASDYNLEVGCYPHTLESFGGPAPYEYSDAVNRVASGGKFSIVMPSLVPNP